MLRRIFPLLAVATLSACSSGEIPIGRIIRELVHRSDGGPSGDGQTCSWQGTPYPAPSTPSSYDIGDEFDSPDGCKECSCTARGIYCTVDTCEACTAEALICPDGSAVGRSGPNCEFAPCPGEGVCPEDGKICADGSVIVRTGPSCEFAPCPGEGIICTDDGKLCPDGSVVGREGPNCEFAPCPDPGGVCTDDAKICPDGSSVGRQGPNCEFAPCPGEVTACTQEAMICPDGSAVGREGPNCEFAPCP